MLITLMLACTPSDGGNNPTDDSSHHQDDSAPPDDSTSPDDSATDDSTSPDDSTPPDDSTVPTGLDVTLTPSTIMVNNVSALVTLDTPSGVVITCEVDTGDPWPERIIIRDDTVALQHTMLIDALLASTTYDCSLADSDGKALTSFDVVTGDLPAELLELTFTVTFDDPLDFDPGWTLFNPTNWEGGSPVAADVVVDPMGRIRWYQVLGEHDGDAAFEYDPNVQEFYGGGGFFIPEPMMVWDMAGNELINWPNVGADHDIDKVGDDYYLLTAGKDGSGGNHCIEERDNAKSLIFSWCTDESDEVVDSFANSLAVHQTTDGSTYLYASMQIKGIVYKLDRDTKEVIWVFDDGGDFAGDVPYAPWMHDLRVIDCPGYTECLLMYVNGDPQSSIRQVGLDEKTMTATVVREWSEPGWEEPKLGGIDVAGDNWLIAQGHFIQDAKTDRPTQLVEVAPDDSVVWRLVVDPVDVETYRSRRVPACDAFHHAGMCPTIK